MICDKNFLFAAGDALPSCTREAAVRLDVEVTRGPSKGGHATLNVCDPCAGMLRLSTGLKVLSTSPLPDQGGDGTVTEYLRPEQLATDEHLGIKVAWIGEDGDALAFTDDLERGTAAILEMGSVDLGGECRAADGIELCWMRFQSSTTDEWGGNLCQPEDEGAVRVVYAQGVSDLVSLGEKLDEAVNAVMLQFDRLVDEDREPEGSAEA